MLQRAVGLPQIQIAQDSEVQVTVAGLRMRRQQPLVERFRFLEAARAPFQDGEPDEGARMLGIGAERLPQYRRRLFLPLEVDIGDGQIYKYSGQLGMPFRDRLQRLGRLPVLLLP